MGISLDASTKIVSITTPTTSVTVQELVNVIRDWEDEQENLAYDHIIDAVGKADLGGGVTTGITMTLSSSWQIQFWNGVARGTLKDGNIVGGVGGVPVKETGGADTILQLGAVATTIATAGESVPTVEEIRIEMDTNSVKMAPSQNLDDYKATGFAVPGEYDTQLGYIPSDLGDVPTGSEMDAAHGAGSWEGIPGSADWSPAERKQIRDALGVDGDKTDVADSRIVDDIKKHDNKITGLVV